MVRSCGFLGYRPMMVGWKVATRGIMRTGSRATPRRHCGDHNPRPRNILVKHMIRLSSNGTEAPERQETRSKELLTFIRSGEFLASNATKPLSGDPREGVRAEHVYLRPDS